MSADAGIVITERGAVSGFSDGGVWVYLGVPFAAPPVGDLRFRPPQPAPCWSGVLPAKHYGPECAQNTATDGFSGSEACLNLNVWAPMNASGLPVMVWIHGGGHWSGSANADYDGTYLAATGSVVVVTVNYRLGVFGYLAHPCLAAQDAHGSSGNYGSLDNVAALRWVQRNIAAFGGDPGNVTIFGESAGAYNVGALLTSPLAAGLFVKAIMESSPNMNPPPSSAAEAQGEIIAAQLGCASASDVPRCLRSLDARTLATLAPGVNGTTGDGQLPLPDGGSINGFAYQPNVDGLFLAANPSDVLDAGAQNPAALLIGTNSGEGAYFVVGVPLQTEAEYQAYVGQAFGDAGPEVLAEYPVSAYGSPQAAAVALIGDYGLTAPARRVARAVSRSQPVYRYFFSHVPSYWASTPYGPYAYHTAELPFVFHNEFQGAFTAAEDALSVGMARAWTSFATTGDPNGDGGAKVTWPTYDAVTDPYLDIDIPSFADGGVRTAQCNFWDDLGH